MQCFWQEIIFCTLFPLLTWFRCWGIALCLPFPPLFNINLDWKSAVFKPPLKAQKYVFDFCLLHIHLHVHARYQSDKHVVDACHRETEEDITHLSAVSRHFHFEEEEEEKGKKEKLPNLAFFCKTKHDTYTNKTWSLFKNKRENPHFTMYFSQESLICCNMFLIMTGTTSTYS